MRRDFSLYLWDILEAAGRIEEYTAGSDLETFGADQRTIDAVIRNLEVIGEAVKHVPDDVRARYPEVPWQRIAGLRDLLIHQYFGVDVKIIWDLVADKLPLLERQVRVILAGEGVDVE